MRERLRQLPRPTRSAALLLLLAVILELLGQLVKSRGITLAAAAAVGAVLGDGLLTPAVDIDSVERHTPDRMAVGVKAQVRITIRARPRRFARRGPVVLRDRAPGLEVGRVVVPRMRPGEQAIAERQAMPERRGCWPDGGTVDVAAYSPFGGFVRRAQHHLAASGWVHPAPAQPMRLPDVTTGEIYGNNTTARAGGGIDFYGVRDWRAGDPASAIHWRVSARRDRLVVVDRERPGHPGLLVVVDRCVDEPSLDEPQWEHALARTAATAVEALRSGRTVVLLAGATAVIPARPRDLLDWFAAVATPSAPDGEALLAALLAVGGGATLLWLGAGTVPAYAERTARAAAAGAVVAVREMAPRR